MTTNTVSVQWHQQMEFESDNPSGKTFLIDTSEQNGGQDNGMHPKALMLSALAGCTGLDVVSTLKKMKVEVDAFKMKVEGSLTDEDPKYYKAVTLTYIFHGADLNQHKIKRAIDLSVEKYCGVMEMFRQFADITIQTQFHEL